MRNVPKIERLHVATLQELDALVGKYLTKETPHTFWEEQQVSLRFDSIEEALDAMRDPYFQQFIPAEALPHSSLTEVREFRAYSSDLMIAWELVERLGDAGNVFRAWREEEKWAATFGECPPSIAPSAAAAICLAALRVVGIEVEIGPDRTLPAPVEPNTASSRFRRAR